MGLTGNWIMQRQCSQSHLLNQSLADDGEGVIRLAGHWAHRPVFVAPDTDGTEQANHAQNAACRELMFSRADIKCHFVSV